MSRIPKDTHVTFDEMKQVMNDKRHYFPGYVLQEVIDSSQHYEKFLATDLQTPSRWYVIKALTKAIALTNEVRQVFEAACHAHARIQLSGIYPVHEIGISPRYGTFIVFPLAEAYLSLLDLSGLRKNGRLNAPAPFYVSIILEAARVLDAAHRQGLAHYTVMPTSVILRPSGDVCVCHFIEAAMRRRYHMGSWFDEKLSAPEWRKNATAGCYSDIYALSAFLYLLLTEQYQPDETDPLWHAMGDVLIASGLSDESVPPLMRFFHSTLAENPENRLSQYPDFIHALESLQAVLGPAFDRQERQKYLHMHFEPFPPNASQNTADICASDLSACSFGSQVRSDASPSGISADRRMSSNHGHTPAPSAIAPSSPEDDASSPSLMEDTLPTPPCPSKMHENQNRAFSHGSADYRAQSPMSKSSVKSVPLQVLARSRYQVLEELGSGGFGSVYKVLDTTLSEVVALKILNPSLVSDHAWLQRFKNEMRLTRDIDHTYILPAYHLEELDGVYFFTMKYINGKNLAQLLQTGPLALQTALRLLSRIGQSLFTAHQHGIIHRDFKPANLMIEADTLHPWLTDFGIASHGDAPLNTPSVLGIGTPYYMSPEQIRGDALTATSDIYSFGVVAYECLTHHLPFNGSSPLAVYKAAMQGQYSPIRELVPSVPPEISDIIEQCLIAEARLRPQSMKTILNILHPFAQD